jgi:hypothetical protein
VQSGLTPSVQLRPIVNPRKDALLKVAHDLHIRPQVQAFSLEHANEALMSVNEAVTDYWGHVGCCFVRECDCK